MRGAFVKRANAEVSGDNRIYFGSSTHDTTTVDE
jgi:hypothetical protein